VIVLIAENPHYDARATFIGLKGNLADHMLLLLVFFYGATSLKETLWLSKALVWIIITASVMTVVDTWNIPDLGIINVRRDGRMEGLTGGPNEFGALMAFFLPATIALYSIETGAKRWIAMLGTVATFLALLITGSRGALLGVFGGAVPAAFYLRQFVSGRMIARSMLLMFALCLVAAIALVAVNVADLLEDRFVTGIGTGNRFDLSSGRTMIWLTALGHMTESPVTFLTGFGWDAYSQTGNRFATHNTYLSYLYNLGLIGLVLFVAIYSNSLATARRGLAVSSTEVAPFLFALVFGISAFMVAMIFGNMELPALYTWAFAGVTLRLALISVAVPDQKRQETRSRNSASDMPQVKSLRPLAKT
jgi:O-antigen ligase